MNYISSQRTKNPMSDEEFHQWLVGFIDGEGNFTIGIDTRNKFTRFNFNFRIGLHIDDLPLLNFIKNRLGCGKIIINKQKDSASFSITDTQDLKSILFPILDKFSLNTTKYLDYLSFKEALILNARFKMDINSRERDINKIISLKESMNRKRIDYLLPLDHIKITSYWLLGLIEGEGSFHLIRASLAPSFSLSLTAVQQPVLDKIKDFLLLQLDEYSLIKAVNTKLINISSEPASGNTKAKVKIQVNQIDYINNIFIPFLDGLQFQSKKKLDFED